MGLSPRPSRRTETATGSYACDILPFLSLWSVRFRLWLPTWCTFRSLGRSGSRFSSSIPTTAGLCRRKRSTGGEPGTLTSDPKRRFLFAALRSTGELAAFRIEPANGKLTLINTVPAGADPAYISTDRSGKFLLTAYYVAGKVTVHAIGADGSLGNKPRQTLRTKEKAHAIVLDP